MNPNKDEELLAVRCEVGFQLQDKSLIGTRRYTLQQCKYPAEKKLSFRRHMSEIPLLTVNFKLPELRHGSGIPSL